MSKTERHEHRQYTNIAEKCHYCGGAAVWYVVDESSFEPDSMFVCDRHKYLAFS